MRFKSLLSISAAAITLSLLSVSAARPAAQQASAIPAPEQFFGFKIGADGELARYPKILEYFQLLAKQTDRVKYEELGKTTMGNSYALLRISSPQNLAKFDRLVEINRRLADPRGLSEAEAQKLAMEGKPFYFVYATIHSTEVSNGQAIINIVHRLATDNSPQVREILDNSRGADGAVAEPRWPAAGDRSLVQDQGHAVRARLPGPVPQVRRPRRQPRLVHVHAEGNAHEHRAGAEQVQADHHPRHAPAGRQRRAHLRAAVHRAVRSQHASAAADGAGARSARRWPTRCSPKARKAWRGKTPTTCGRRRGSTWSTTASRASSPKSPTATSPIP